MRTTLIFVVIALILLPAANGCVWAPELESIHRDIAGQLPGAVFKKEIALSLNPLAVVLARSVVKLIPEAQEAAPYLGDVRDVTLAVYEVDNLPPDPQIRLPKKLTKLLARGEWELAVKIREHEEHVWILSKSDGGRLEGLYVIALDAESLVLVRAHGRLERLAMKALRDNGGLSFHG